MNRTINSCYRDVHTILVGSITVLARRRLWFHLLLNRPKRSVGNPRVAIGDEGGVHWGKGHMSLPSELISDIRLSKPWRAIHFQPSSSSSTASELAIRFFKNNLKNDIHSLDFVQLSFGLRSSWHPGISSTLSMRSTELFHPIILPNSVNPPDQ